jgi:hypothetical protein
MMTEFSQAFVSFVAFLLIRTIPYWEGRLRDLVTYHGRVQRFLEAITGEML